MNGDLVAHGITADSDRDAQYAQITKPDVTVALFFLLDTTTLLAD